MSELTITLLRVGYLALLWVFVFTAIGVIRRDLVAARPGRLRRGRAAEADGTASAPYAPSPPPGVLHVLEGPLAGREVPLHGSPVLIGRTESCTLVIDDDYTSSRHARVFPSGERWMIEDLDSTNGTFVDQVRISQPIALEPGSSVRIGQSVLELRR